MAEVYGDTAGFPDARESAPPLDAGRLGGVFCQLFRQKFTGVVQIEGAGRNALVGFRDGKPVNVEDSTSRTSLGDELVERGTITRAQYAAVIARVTDGLVHNEDIAFCEHAVDMGFLTLEQAQAELSERTRTRLLQVLSWSECDVALDASEEALSGQGEFPQELGALVYMGVRTFYDDDQLRSYLPDPARNYVRLIAPAAGIGAFFALDEDELKLLRALDPQSPFATLIGASILDPAHAVSVLALLSIARLCEFSSSPFSPPEADRSGTRPSPAAQQRGMSNGGMPAVRPRATSQTMFQAARTRPLSEGITPPVQEERPFQTRSPLPAAGRPASQMRTSAVSPGPAVTPRPASSPTPAEPARAAVPVSSVDATQEALREAAARASRRRGMTPGAQRAVREPELPRAVPGAAPAQAKTAHEPPAAAPDPSVRAEYAKAHLNELMKRRRQALQQPAGAPKRDPMRQLRQAQELLRDQHYPKAEELLRELIEQEPANDMFRTYYLWAKHRAQPDADDGQLQALLDLAKKLTSDPAHGPFACYVLGHVYLALKKDELAEKYFRRAHTADKSNKDAERHLLIMERRKQQAAEAEAAGNRKIFGITIASKPKS